MTLCAKQLIRVFWQETAQGLSNQRHGVLQPLVILRASFLVAAFAPVQASSVARTLMRLDSWTAHLLLQFSV